MYSPLTPVASLLQHAARMKVIYRYCDAWCRSHA